MTRLGTKLRSVEGGLVAFWCPGCDARHHVAVVDSATAMAWAYNGNPDAPTFSPSVLVRSGHHIPGWVGPTCWCNSVPREPKYDHGFKCIICHSFVTDGQISFLADSTHKLAGQTVSLPDFGTLS
jgi:Family of unknown function (DUF6527)